MHSNDLFIGVALDELAKLFLIGADPDMFDPFNFLGGTNLDVKVKDDDVDSQKRLPPVKYLIPQSARVKTPYDGDLSRQPSECIFKDRIMQLSCSIISCCCTVKSLSLRDASALIDLVKKAKSTIPLPTCTFLKETIIVTLARFKAHEGCVDIPNFPKK